MVGAHYSKGLVHIADWHASFAALGGVAPNPTALALDGLNVLPALLANTSSPRTEFLINIDPIANCASGPDSQVVDCLPEVRSSTSAAPTTTLTTRSLPGLTPPGRYRRQWKRPLGS